MTGGLVRVAAAAAACLLCVTGPTAVAARGPVDALESPVEPVRAIYLFDAPPAPWAPGHRGIDLAAERGQQVSAPAAGVVTFAGRVVDRGVVSVALDGGLVVSVEPVAPDVAAGDRVTAGQSLGTVGAGRSHCATACLHLGVRRDGEYINPLDVLAGFGPVRLLPLDG